VRGVVDDDPPPVLYGVGEGAPHPQVIVAVDTADDGEQE
jgi:hypothetical protein